MKLLRFGNPGEERPGILDNHAKIRDLSSAVPDLSGEFLSPHWMDRIRSVDVESLPLVAAETRLGSCVPQPGKFVCIGLNYSDHAAESGMAVPVEPVVL